MDMREKLSKLGCKPETHNYLGDGVYCGFDGTYVWLVVDRNGLSHEIALENEVLAALYRYANPHFVKP